MNLLIVEDEYRLADMLNDWFVKKGDSVSICTNGLEGFKKAAADSFDVIILDSSKFNLSFEHPNDEPHLGMLKSNQRKSF